MKWNTSLRGTHALRRWPLAPARHHTLLWHYSPSQYTVAAPPLILAPQPAGHGTSPHCLLQLGIILYPK